MSDHSPEARNVTAPLVSAEVDLRGLPWMRLDTGRLLDSDLFALSSGDEFKAAVALWCKAWTQKPAGSLPTDDRVLAHLAGMTGIRWRKVKAMALRGWVLCEDGRLYHPVVAEQVLVAWEERLSYQERETNRNSREENYRNEHKALRDALRERGQVFPWNAKIGDLRAALEQLNAETYDAGNDTNDGPSTRQRCTNDAPPTAKTGRDGTGRKSNSSTPDTTARTAGSEGQGHDAGEPRATTTEAGAACKAMRAAGMLHVNPSDQRLHDALADGVTAAALEAVALEALSKSPPKGFAWAIATAHGRHLEAPGATHGTSTPSRKPSLAERAQQHERDANEREHGPPDGDDATVIDGTARRVG